MNNTGLQRQDCGNTADCSRCAVGMPNHGLGDADGYFLCMFSKNLFDHVGFNNITESIEVAWT
ncbi:hypothetical protein [Nitrosomonas aestuarii]|uniref:hypothetical protein n=1 Tax=Nitrosomonas aestuarii TaxID=52441 RepID=UPI0015E696EE|nr:hypothetical protein [Nitrosomonas aestuarii]